MSGAYCRYCDRRCFVERVVASGPRAGWRGHMATCAAGAAFDRSVLGADYRTNSLNPLDPKGATHGRSRAVSGYTLHGAPSGRVWRINPRFGDGEPITEADAIAMARELGWEVRAVSDDGSSRVLWSPAPEGSL